MTFSSFRTGNLAWLSTLVLTSALAPDMGGAIFRIQDPAVWSVSLPTPPVVDGFGRVSSTVSPVLIRGDLTFESDSGFYALPHSALSTWVPGEAITIRFPSDVRAVSFKAYSTFEGGDFANDRITVRYSGGTFTESINVPTFVGLSSTQPISWVNIESRSHFTSIDDVSYSVIPEPSQVAIGVGLLLCLTSLSMHIYRRRSR